MIDPRASQARLDVVFDDGDRVFLCEGRDEIEVVAHLTRDWPRKPKIGIKADRPGLTWADELKALAAQIPIRKIAAIGLMFDVEGDRASREADLREWFDHAGLVKPDRPNEIRVSEVDGTNAGVAYLLNPDGGASGDLEDLFLLQVRASPVGRCVSDLMKCYAANCPPKATNHGKVELRSFIAHSNGHNTALGLAVRDGHLSCAGPEFDSLRRFVDLIGSA